MQKLAKKIVVSILGWQVRRLYKKNNFKVVAVAGSLGKTSTKLAIAQVLGAKYKVRHQGGNYNDIVTVPLIFFGHSTPSLFNPFSWMGIFWSNETQLHKKYPYEVVIVEVGTDGPGQIVEYAKFLKADIGVLTAVAPEHMEFFDDLDAVAKEELQIANLSEKIIVNTDFVEPKYLKTIKNPTTTYAMKTTANISLENVKFAVFSANFDVLENNKLLLSAQHEAVAEPRLYAVAGAVAVARELGMEPGEIKTGLDGLKPTAGRMQKLGGINNSTIIDDTYNASPPAMKAALDTLYRLDAPQKIAILGNMNELGSYSKAAHEEIGNYCDPKKLDLVITLGPDANKYLAPAAEAKGCKVQQFENPYLVGDYLKLIIKNRALILAKGSQNRVFAEEAVKLLLANPADAKKLVRQSDSWLKIKAKAFKT
ncbi:MAG: UDP-N-acetylmuramoyl-tripeptide--D-alanyl-D-alanine ligase [bacterium]|nr:UDP-N-acetylmuramoyl-tripeptide--D-alanyl-D-alanine ligase [bacterium]